MQKSLWKSTMCTSAVSAGFLLAGSAQAAACEDSAIAGAWQGPFADTVLTFVFTHDSTGWSGQSRAVKNWYPLMDLSVRDCVATFGVAESKPPMSFSLKIDDAGQTLSGAVSVEGAPVTFPITLARLK